MRALLLLLTVIACSGPSSPPVPAWPAVTAWTTLDLHHLDNYAAPELPAPYLHQAVADIDNSRTAPITDTLATLGRVLFFDPRLSVSGTISCATCHLPRAGFADTAAFSRGHAGVSVAVRTMRLGNARWYGGPGFLWDRRATTLEAQALQPLVHPVEMGWDAGAGGLSALRARMASTPYYPELFIFAFGDSSITDARMAQALAAYVRSIIAVRSRWDAGYAQVFDSGAPDQGLLLDVPTLDARENLGRRLFIAPRDEGGLGCASCHVPPTFSLAADALNNGLRAGETVLFKSPSLKNVALTGPYMHNGMLASLMLVVAFYDGFTQPGPTLDPRLVGPGGTQLRFDLTQAEREAVVAFLHTLTDTTWLGDPRFRSPFRD